MINTLGAIVIILCIAFAISFYKSILSGVDNLLDGTQKITQKRYSTRVDDNRSDEFGHLARNFNKMAEAIEKAQKKILKANKAKDSFLANISHEIRTPMNGVLGMVQLLADTELTKEQKDMVVTMSSCGDSLVLLLNDLLDMSKIESGKLELEEIAFDLNICINESIYLSSFKASQKTIDIKYDGRDDLKFVGDVTRIRQIIFNLMANAVKFTDKGHVKVQVKTEEIKSGKILVTIAIEDSGIGISKKDQKKLFKDFSQADSSISRKYGGTGLGLSISYKLAKLMGGDIKLQSEEGRGSIFTLTLELTKAKAAEVREVAELEKINHNHVELNGHVLLAEDNVVNQRITYMILTQMGFRCDIAANGAEAIKMMDDASTDNKYDFILMDMQMPEMDGITATKKLREKYGDKLPPVVALTANAYQEDKDKCMQAGMVGFVDKPIKVDDLKRVAIQYTKN